jgi:hypothetical protein
MGAQKTRPHIKPLIGIIIWRVLSKQPECSQSEIVGSDNVHIAKADASTRNGILGGS